jgi:prepilin-type processing-associated H-X9-DG protein
MIGDCGAITYDNNPGTFAYPDICAIECGVSAWEWHDWVLCASTAAACGLYNYAPDDGSFIANPDLRRPYARHLGGVNIGFLDGHATWVNSDAFLAHIKDGTWSGVHGDGPITTNPACACFFTTYPGVPTLY